MQDGNEQGSTPNSTTGAQGAAGAPAAEQGSSASASASDVEALRAEIKALKAENFKYREKDRERRTARETEAKEQGKFQALAESHEQTITELRTQVEQLSAFEADANAWRQHVQAEANRIDEAKSKLPESQQAILDAIPDVAARGRALDALLGGDSPARQTPTLPSATPAPAAPAVTNFGDMTPQQVTDFKDRVRASGAPQNSMAALQQQ